MKYTQLDTPAIYGEAQAGESAEVRKELEGLISTINASTFDLAALLFKVKSKGFYKGYGFNSFLEYVKELEIKTRKAQYLVRIAEIMDELQVPREKFEPVGIAKLREITSIDLIDKDGDPALYENPETGETYPMVDVIKGLLEKAPTMDLNEIKKYVRVIKGLVGENDIVWLNISVTQQMLDQTIKPALDLSKKNLGSSYKDEDGVYQDYSDGKALEVISAEYLNDPANSYIGEKSD